jgi:hypothetical protein
MTTLPKTLTIEGVTYHRAPEPAPQPAPQPAPLGEPWLPKMGERYWYLNSVGWVAHDEWWSTSTDRARRAFGNCFATEAEATAARDTIALTLRARRVASDLWAERGMPLFHHTDRCWTAVAHDNRILAREWSSRVSPYRFATKADCDRFIEAIGRDAIRELLGATTPTPGPCAGEEADTP